MRNGRGRQSPALPRRAVIRPGRLGRKRLSQHRQQHDGQRQAGKPQRNKASAALLAAAGRRTGAARGARAGRGGIAIRRRLPGAGRSLRPALGRHADVPRTGPPGVAMRAAVDIFILCLHAYPPFFVIFR